MTARAFIALGALAIGAAGCGDSDALCGSGTINREGLCVVDPSVNAAYCGPDTHYDSLRVECASNVAPLRCNDDTTRIESGDGTVLCVCEPDACEVPLPCTPPSAGGVSVCGTVIDAQTGELLAGSTAVRVAAYDVDELVAALGDATPLATAAAIDECGRYRLHDVPLPANGFIAVVVDDGAGAPADDYEISARVLELAAGVVVEDVTARATTRATDDAWTATAGDPFSGQSFVDRGVALVRFSTAGAPAAGVQFLCNGEPFFDAYYFGDTDETTASTVDATRLSSGANGSVLITGVPTINQCEPSPLAGCAWSEPIGAVTAIRGAATFAEYLCE